VPAQASARRPQIQLNLPPYPFFANLQSVMAEDRALLDRLLAAYTRQPPAASQHPIDFLSRYVPVSVFERTLQPSEPNDPARSTLLWLMHLAGYFGGVWLRTAFVNAGVECVAESRHSRVVKFRNTKPCMVICTDYC